MLSTAIRGLVRAAMAGVVVFTALAEPRRTAFLCFAGWLAVHFVLVIWLPRAAHRAFRHGLASRAKLLYKALRVWALRASARASIDVSLAACALAVEDWDGALAQLESTDSDSLGSAARAAWLNNWAYALARTSRDPRAALARSDEAIALRPDVAGFHHTRGLALLELGRVEEAISELDSMWSQLASQTGEDMHLLEAERCYDLGRAWQQKGESDYASDYFQRARRAAPGSRWAGRAAQHLEPVSEEMLAELIG